jgi:hypothetical protein
MTKVDLRRAIRRTGMSDDEAMDAMQREAWPRVVSDLCVRVEDVAMEDIARAVEWLETYGVRF